MREDTAHRWRGYEARCALAPALASQVEVAKLSGHVSTCVRRASRLNDAAPMGSHRGPSAPRPPRQLCWWC